MNSETHDTEPTSRRGIPWWVPSVLVPTVLLIFSTTMAFLIAERAGVVTAQAKTLTAIQESDKNSALTVARTLRIEESIKEMSTKLYAIETEQIKRLSLFSRIEAQLEAVKDGQYRLEKAIERLSGTKDANGKRKTAT